MARWYPDAARTRRSEDQLVHSSIVVGRSTLSDLHRDGTEEQGASLIWSRDARHPALPPSRRVREQHWNADLEHRPQTEYDTGGGLMVKRLDDPFVRSKGYHCFVVASSAHSVSLLRSQLRRCSSRGPRLDGRPLRHHAPQPVNHIHSLLPKHPRRSHHPHPNRLLSHTHGSPSSRLALPEESMASDS